MSLSTLDIFNTLIAVGLLLAGSHIVGFIFSKLKQARVIGEITGGLILGPTLFGAICPQVYQSIFTQNQATQIILSGIFQAGLFLLMFCSGFEMKSHFHRSERKTAILNTITGILFPLFCAFLAIQKMDIHSLMGPAQSEKALSIVFGIAVAITSIPVISRILHDLGFLNTRFGRIVILSAIFEDMILYIFLAVALSMVNSAKDNPLGLAQYLPFDPGSWSYLFYHTAITLSFILLAIAVGPLFFRWVRDHRYNILGVSNPVAFHIIFMLILIGLAIFFGITPMFGAFVAGIISGRSGEDSLQSKKIISSFSFAFFIPIYFAVVGLRLNLLHEFDLHFFLLFLLFACLIKLISVFMGSRISGENSWSSLNLAVAMNARGGPGIVLASVALDAQIISKPFYGSLIMLAIITSMLAGFWLDLVRRKKWPLE